MMKKRALFLIFTIMSVTLLTACQVRPELSNPGSATPTLAFPQSTPTIEVSPSQAITQTSEPQPVTGSIRGKLGYPSEVIPELTIIAFLFGSDTYYSIDTEFNQTEYQLDNLAEGNYHVVAYTRGSDSFPAGLSGSFTQAVQCGMQESCTDHQLVDVVVRHAQTATNVDLVDWLVPLPPLPQTGEPVQGTITGGLSYPSEMVPAMRVVAYQVENEQTYFVDTQNYETFYTLPVPAGNYYVVAYTRGEDIFPIGLAGGYTQVVPCGFTENCSDHSLIEVVVTQGSVTSGIDPGDFYAPEGTFPPMP